MSGWLLLALATALHAPCEVRVGLTRVATSVRLVGGAGQADVVLAAGGARAGSTTVLAAPDGGPVTVAIGYRPGDPGVPRRYRGAVAVTPLAGTLAVVNRLDLEAYVQGVVPLEIGARAPAAALQAQALAARTYALRRRGDGQRPVADFEVALTQVYRGCEAETPATNAAVAATRGQTVQLGGRLLDTVYSTCCGGVTASVDDAWNHTAAGLTPVLDAPRAGVPRLDEPLLLGWLATDSEAWCRHHALFRWQRSVTLADLAPRLQAWLSRHQPTARIGALRELQVARRAPSGRVVELVAKGDLGEARLTGDRLRWAFGAGDQALPSTLFALAPEAQGYTLRGAGWGHGVGLCQAGAVAMASEGCPVGAIIAHYYGGARIVGDGEPGMVTGAGAAAVD